MQAAGAQNLRWALPAVALLAAPLLLPALHGVGGAIHTVLGDQHGHWQGVHQFRVAKHGSGIS